MIAPSCLLVLFLLGFVSDLLWCRLVKSVHAGAAVKASATSVALEGFKLATAWIVIRNDSFAGAAAFLVGCAIGTYVSTRFK